MGYVVAYILIALIIAGLVGGTVLHPFLYGLFIAAIIIVPIFAANKSVDGIFNAIFKNKK